MAGADAGFPIRGRRPISGMRRPPMRALLSENNVKTVKIRQCIARTFT